MARTLTYNGVVLPVTGIPGKGVFSGTDRTLRLTVPFTASGADVTSYITALRAQNKDVVIALGTWTATYTVTTNAVAVRSDVQKLGSADDSDGMKRFALVLDIDLNTTFADGFAEWQSNDSIDERGAKTIEITGRVTAQASTASSLAVYEAGIGAIQAMVEAYFDSAEYEQPADAFTIDRLDRSLTFSRRLVELLQENNTASGYDSTIVLVRWGITRDLSAMLDRGSDEVSNWRFRVSWEAAFPKSKTDMTTQYDGTIRQLVIEKIRSVFTETGSLSFVLLDDQYDFNPTTCRATGNWLVNATSGLISYDEEVGIPYQYAQSEKIMDGKAFTEAPYTVGLRARLTQTVKAVTRGGPYGVPSPPSLTSLNGVGVSLVLESGEPKRVNRIVGRAGGSTVSDTDYTLNWSGTWIVVARSTGAPPSTNPGDILRPVTGGGVTVAGAS